MIILPFLHSAEHFSVVQFQRKHAGFDAKQWAEMEAAFAAVRLSQENLVACDCLAGMQQLTYYVDGLLGNIKNRNDLKEHLLKECLIVDEIGNRMTQVAIDDIVSVRSFLTA